MSDFNPEQISLSLSATEANFHTQISRLLSGATAVSTRKSDVQKLKSLYDETMTETKPTFDIMDLMDKVVKMRNKVDLEDPEYKGRRAIKVFLGHRREMELIGGIIDLMAATV